MTSFFQDLAATIADEERAAVSHLIGQHVTAIRDQPAGPVRARVFCAALLIGSAELWAHLEDHATVATQLRRLADRFDTAGAGPSH